MAETGQAVPAGLPGQGLLGLDPRAQVMLVTQVVRHLAGLVFDRRKVQLVPPDSNVFAVVEDDALVLLAAADRLGQGTNSLWVGTLSLNKSAVATDHLGTGVAGELLEGRVDVEHRLVVGLHVDYDDAADTAVEGAHEQSRHAVWPGAHFVQLPAHLHGDRAVQSAGVHRAKLWFEGRPANGRHGRAAPLRLSEQPTLP